MCLFSGNLGYNPMFLFDCVAVKRTSSSASRIAELLRSRWPNKIITINARCIIHIRAECVVHQQSIHSAVQQTKARL